MIRRRSLIDLVAISVLIVAQLHLLRNLSPIYSFFYLIQFFIAVWFVFHRWRLILPDEKLAINFILAIFFIPIFSIIPGFFSGAYGEVDDLPVGISRVLFSLPIYLAILASPSTKKMINKLLVTTTLITLFAALSIPYQFIFGPIAWFAVESERSGFARYASLFGSLTALGIVCGYGILSASISIKSTFWLAVIVAGIVLGGVLSLQKAAIANILLCIAFLPFLTKIKVKKILFFIAIFLVISSVLAVYFGQEIEGYLGSIRLFSNSESNLTDDLSLSESILDRVTRLPLIAINYHGLESLLFGLGPIGGSGSFGYPKVPMSHNGVVDLFLIGGVTYFLLFFLFIIFVIRAACLGKRGSDDAYILRFGVFCFIVLLINIPFSGLILFSPSNAMFFAVSIKCILLKSRKNTLAN